MVAIVGKYIKVCQSSNESNGVKPCRLHVMTGHQVYYAALWFYVSKASGLSTNLLMTNLRAVS